MKEITDTGVRGFLKWFQQAQPGLYQKIAPEITKHATGAFDDYHAGYWKVAGLGQADALQMLSVDPGLISIPNVDVSDAADSGAKSSSLTNTISNIVNGISTLYMTKKQADIQQQVVNTQLQRAALGLPPLPTSLSNLGVPQVSVGLSGGTGTGLVIAGIAVAGLVLFSMMGRGGNRARR
jgi:hypothetical protein